MSRIAYEDLTVAERLLLEELKTETARSIARNLLLECRANRKADRPLRATLAAHIAHEFDPDLPNEDIAAYAVAMADALLAEVDKDGGK